MFIGSSCNLSNESFEPAVVVNNTPVSRTGIHKCLGVQIDEKLTWDRHIDMISCKKASVGSGAMRSIRPFVPSNSLEKVNKRPVQPYFDHRSPLWDNCRNLLKDKIHRFQSRARTVITSASYDIRSADFIEALPGTPWIRDGSVRNQLWCTKY